MKQKKAGRIIRRSLDEKHSRLKDLHESPNINLTLHVEASTSALYPVTVDAPQFGLSCDGNTILDAIELLLESVAKQLRAEEEN